MPRKQNSAVGVYLVVGAVWTVMYAMMIAAYFGS